MNCQELELVMQLIQLIILQIIKNKVDAAELFSYI